MDHAPWLCPFFTTSVFLLALHDHSLRGFISEIMALPATNHIFTDTDPLLLLVCHLVLLLIIMVYAHLHVNHIWVECSLILNCNCVHEYVLQMSSAFHNLLSALLLCHYWALPDVLCVVCYLSVCPYHPYFVSLPFVVCTVALYNHTIHPQPTIFPLHRYCRPYRKRKWIFVSIIALELLILSQFEHLIVFIICIEVDWLPINLG